MRPLGPYRERRMYVTELPTVSRPRKREFVLMAIAALLALFLYAKPTAAGEQLRLEVLAGQCEAERLPDGGWWSAHYPHAFDLRSDCYQLSVSEIFTQRAGWDLGMRVGHVDMGRMYVRALWWLRDEDFQRKPDGQSCDPRTMKDCLGRGTLWQKVRGFTLGGLAERQVLPPLRLGVEGGLFVYEGSFQVSVKPYPHPDTYKGWTSGVYRGWQLSPYLGATANIGYVMFSARVYTIVRAAEHGCGGCSGPTKGPVTQIAAGVQIPF